MMLKKSLPIEESLYDILDSTTSFELKEAYNSLCTTVLHSENGDQLKTLAITSSIYGEGKTSLAINFAYALACNLIDKKVLLVDADFRKSNVAAFMKNRISVPEEMQGLSKLLVSDDEFPTVIETNLENMDVVLSGSAPLNPAGLINSLKMKDFLAKCSETYDYVIIDTPPINVVSDALLLIGGVDGYIIAAKNKFSKIPALDATQKALNSVGANVLGIVLTEIKK